MIWAALLVIFVSLVKGDNHENNWMHNVIYYEAENLTCENSEVKIAELPTGSSLTWILPNGKILKPGEKHPRVQISSKGDWLYINRTNDEDFGIYICLVFNNGILVDTVRKGVNVDGPFWGHMAERYIPRAITGAIACAITFAIVCVFCFCYEREQDRGEKAIMDYDAQMHGKDGKGGQQNKGYEFDAIDMQDQEKPKIQNGVEVQCVTKM